MPIITPLTPEERKDRKIKKPYAIKYKCKCGVELTLEADMKPDKLSKCFKCGLKYEKIT